MSLASLQTRINYAGGDALGRIKMQKLRSFRAALKNDYNSRIIELETGDECPCLINANNLKPDYDKKYISIDFEHGLQAGDTFRCTDDNTSWMIYLPVLTEIAYLRAEIIRCRYQLDINGKKYWIYFQGPTETDISWNIKNEVNWNDLNLSGTIYIKRDENTLNHFDRFTKIKIDGHVWQVSVVDSITVPGIIELKIQEYFDSITDDIEIEEAEEIEEYSFIEGKTKVYPYDILRYSAKNPFGTYEISDPKMAKIVSQKDGSCKVEVLSAKSGSFTLIYTIDQLSWELEIEILSL